MRLSLHLLRAFSAPSPQLRVKALSTSGYVEPHKENVVQWDEVLGSCRGVIEAWVEVQGKWAALAPLFGPRGLAGQLVMEARRFVEVTREWRVVIKHAMAVSGEVGGSRGLRPTT